MIKRNKRITALVGNYGSGKTEIALGLALDIKKAGAKNVMLVDLDIVNPYFRSATQRQLLENCGIEVEQPSFALTTVDIPALPASILRIFERPELEVIIDVGGDDTGAAALGQYKTYLDREGCDLLYVINVRRPLSSNADDIIDMMGEIQARARVPIAGLINNTNLQNETTLADVLEGQTVIEEVSRRTGIPVRAVVAGQHIIDEMPKELRAIASPIERHLEIEWL